MGVPIVPIWGLVKLSKEDFHSSATFRKVRLPNLPVLPLIFTNLAVILRFFLICPCYQSQSGYSNDTQMISIQQISNGQ